MKDKRWRKLREKIEEKGKELKERREERERMDKEDRRNKETKEREERFLKLVELLMLAYDGHHGIQVAVCYGGHVRKCKQMKKIYIIIVYLCHFTPEQNKPVFLVTFVQQSFHLISS